MKGLLITCSIAALATNSALAGATATNVTGSIWDVLSYLDDRCLPYNNATGVPYGDTPCWAVKELLWRCTYNTTEDWYEVVNGTFQWNDIVEPELPLRNTQVCICGSQYFVELQGCQACYIDHGYPAESYTLPAAYYSSASSTYCAVENTVTPYLPDIQDYPDLAASLALPPVTSIHDPIGTDTAVSWYWTEALTGSEAYRVSVPTETGSNLHYSTLSGQIVETVTPSFTPNYVAVTASLAYSTATTASTQSTGSAARTNGIVGALAVVGLLNVLVAVVL